MNQTAAHQLYHANSGFSLCRRAFLYLSHSIIKKCELFLAIFEAQSLFEWSSKTIKIPFDLISRDLSNFTQRLGIEDADMKPN